MSDIIRRTTIENQAEGFPAPPGVEKNFVNPENNAWATIPAGWTLIAIAIVLVALRFIAKFQDKKRIFRWDDHLALLAVIFGFVRVVMVTFVIRDYGIGRHIWDIPASHFPRIWHLFDIEDMMYCFGILCAKLSICVFYLNMFGINRKFRWAVYGTMVLTTLYLLVSFFTYVFHCGVKTWIGLATKCLDGITQEIAIGGFNIATDVLILVLPIPQVWQLRLSTSKRVGLTFVFLLGSFTIVATVLREVFAITTLSTVDQTWNTSEVVLWKTIEMCVGIICSNLLTGPFILRYVLSTTIGAFVYKLLSNTGSRFSHVFSSKHSSEDTGHYGNMSYSKHSGDSHSNSVGTATTVETVDLEKGSTWLETGSQEALTKPTLASGKGIKVTSEFGVSD